MYIENLINDVEKTHRNFGKLVAMLQVASRARKLTLVISPSGCGKSTAMEIIARNTPNVWRPDRTSIAGIANKQEMLTSFRSVIIVDDITTTGSEYARSAVVTVLVALCYSHKIESAMHGVEYNVEDFYGSALIGVQPIFLRSLMLLDEWEGSIQDKALRYYHLYRPTAPSISLPDVRLNSGIDYDKVSDFEPNVTNKNWQKLLNLGYSQWSMARAKEHMQDFLKAVASIEGRREVIDSDYAVLLDLLKPMAIENIVVQKESLEGERYLDNNLLALLCEYYSYNGSFPLAQVALDFKCSLQQTYKIMGSQNGNWQQISKSPTVYQPSKRLQETLEIYSLEVKKNDG